MIENTPPIVCDFSAQKNNELTQMEQSLRCRLGHRVQGLRIWTEPHGLVITGCTRSYYDKQMAQHLVREIWGQDVADNRISVDPALAANGSSQSDGLHKHQFDNELSARHRPHRQHFPR